MSANKNQAKAKTDYLDKWRPDCYSTGTQDMVHKIVLPDHPSL